MSRAFSHLGREIICDPEAFAIRRELSRYDGANVLISIDKIIMVQVYNGTSIYE
jgi:hypothetical protein